MLYEESPEKSIGLGPQIFQLSSGGCLTSRHLQKFMDFSKDDSFYLSPHAKATMNGTMKEPDYSLSKQLFFKVILYLHNSKENVISQIRQVRFVFRYLPVIEPL